MSAPIEGADGQAPERQEWLTADGRTLVVDYDSRGCTDVTREAMTELLIAAGLQRKPQSARPDATP